MDTDNTNPCLWSFIQTKRATQCASLKALQRFVLSLSKDELQHMIESYLKSKLSSHDFTASTCTHFCQVLLHDAPDSGSMDEMDQNILCKMNEKYGNKYKKRIIAKMQQHESQTKPQLISTIPPQILAYSFQYLSFRELCRIEKVCSYFTYLHRKYQNLSHYFINLDARFWTKAMRNQMNLAKLSQFKHIKITASYRGPWKLPFKTKLFNLILNHVMSKSITCLDTLEIDIPNKWMIGKTRTFNYHTFTVLDHVLSTFDSFSISKLIWTKDTFLGGFSSERSKMLVSIKTKLLNKCKNLKHLSFGVNNFCKIRTPYNGMQHVSMAAELTKHIIFPVIHGYAQLQTLELHCPSWNVFAPQHHIMECIAKLQNIRKLSIVSYVGDVLWTELPETDIHNISLKELSVEFGCVCVCIRSHSVQQILWQLFSTFIGITHFQFAFALRGSDWYGHRNIYPQQYCLDVDWYQLFHHLSERKIENSIDDLSLPRLESLQIDTICFKDAYILLKDLRLLKDTFYLTHFGLHVVGSWKQQDVFKKFVNNCLVPFLIPYKDSLSLKSLDISCGCGYKLHHHDGDEWNMIRSQNLAAFFQIEASYHEPILKLLSTLPHSLTAFKLKSPNYITNDDKERRQIWRIGSMQLVQTLCKMLSDQNHQTNSFMLESVVLETVRLTKKAKEFLTLYSALITNCITRTASTIYGLSDMVLIAVCSVFVSYCQLLYVVGTKKIKKKKKK
eukprot:663548_1